MSSQGTARSSRPSWATTATGNPAARIRSSIGSDRASVAAASKGTSGAVENAHRPACAARADSQARYVSSPGKAALSAHQSTPGSTRCPLPGVAIWPSSPARIASRTLGPEAVA